MVYQSIVKQFIICKWMEGQQRGQHNLCQIPVKKLLNLLIFILGSISHSIYSSLAPAFICFTYFSLEILIQFLVCYNNFTKSNLQVMAENDLIKNKSPQQLCNDCLIYDCPIHNFSLYDLIVQEQNSDSRSINPQYLNMQNIDDSDDSKKVNMQFFNDSSQLESNHLLKYILHESIGQESETIKQNQNQGLSSECKGTRKENQSSIEQDNMSVRSISVEREGQIVQYGKYFNIVLNRRNQKTQRRKKGKKQASNNQDKSNQQKKSSNTKDQRTHLGTISSCIVKLIQSKEFFTKGEILQFFADNCPGRTKEEKTIKLQNIIRRVYDSLNVLEESGLIEKKQDRHYLKDAYYMNPYYNLKRSIFSFTFYRHLINIFSAIKSRKANIAFQTYRSRLLGILVKVVLQQRKETKQIQEVPNRNQLRKAIKTFKKQGKSQIGLLKSVAKSLNENEWRQKVRDKVFLKKRQSEHSNIQEDLELKETQEILIRKNTIDLFNCPTNLRKSVILKNYTKGVYNQESKQEEAFNLHLMDQGQIDQKLKSYVDCFREIKDQQLKVWVICFILKALEKDLVTKHQLDDYLHEKQSKEQDSKKSELNQNQYLEIFEIPESDSQKEEQWYNNMTSIEQSLKELKARLNIKQTQPQQNKPDQSIHQKKKECSHVEQTHSKKQAKEDKRKRLRGFKQKQEKEKPQGDLDLDKPNKSEDLGNLFYEEDS